MRCVLFFACALSEPSLHGQPQPHLQRPPQARISQAPHLLSTLLGLRDHPRRFAKFRCQALVSSKAWIVGISFLNFCHFSMMMVMMFSSCKPHFWLLNRFVRLPSAFSVFFGEG